MLVDFNGSILNNNSLARVQMGISMRGRIEQGQRQNIKSCLKKVLISSSYREKGKEKKFVNFQGEEVSALCAIQPILLQMQRYEAKEVQVFSEQQHLAGFTVSVDCIHKQVETPGRALTDANYPGARDRKRWGNGSAWGFIEKRRDHVFPDNIVIVAEEEPTTVVHPEEGFTECYGERIITKRLVQGKLRDLYLRKFYLEENQELPTREDVELEHSIFRDTISKLRINSENERNITRKNLLNNIQQKENRNVYIKLYKFVSALWVTVLLVCGFCVLNKAQVKLSQLTSDIKFLWDGLDLINLTS
jgi:hypothetical protein